MRGYVTPDEIRQYLGLDENRWTDSVLQPLIEEAEAWIDRISNTTWNTDLSEADTNRLPKKVREYHDITRYKGGLWLGIGVPVHLVCFPVVKIESLKIWNGKTYDEWIGKAEEGRGKDYWVDYQNGVIYLNRLYWWWVMGGKEIIVEYKYGRADLPAYVKELARLLVCRHILTMDRYRYAVTEGVSGLNPANMLAQINARIEQLEGMIKAVHIPFTCVRVEALE